MLGGLVVDSVSEKKLVSLLDLSVAPARAEALDFRHQLQGQEDEEMAEVPGQWPKPLGFGRGKSKDLLRNPQQ